MHLDNNCLPVGRLRPAESASFVILSRSSSTSSRPAALIPALSSATSRSVAFMLDKPTCSRATSDTAADVRGHQADRPRCGGQALDKTWFSALWEATLRSKLSRCPVWARPFHGHSRRRGGITAHIQAELSWVTTVTLLVFVKFRPRTTPDSVSLTRGMCHVHELMFSKLAWPNTVDIWLGSSPTYHIRSTPALDADGEAVVDVPVRWHVRPH